jgi:hypothetical protein
MDAFVDQATHNHGRKRTMREKKQSKESKGWNPEVNRRWLLRRAALLGGSAFLAESILPHSLKAQIPTVTRTTRTVDLQASSKFRTAFQGIKSTGNFTKVNTAWAAPIRSLSPMERAVAVSVVEISQNNPNCNDIGGKIGLMLKAASQTTPDMLSDIRDQVINQSTGGICGGGCRDAEGYICGIKCEDVKDGILAIDQMGAVLQQSDLVAMTGNLAQTAAAFDSAADIYNDIFR